MAVIGGGPGAHNPEDFPTLDLPTGRHRGNPEAVMSTPDLTPAQQDQLARDVAMFDRFDNS